MAKLTNSPKQVLGLDLERRKSFTFQVSVVNTDGNPVDLTGCTMRFVLKPAAYDDDHFDVTNILVNSNAAIPEPEAGYGVFSFQAAELDQTPGEYFGALVLWTPTGYSLTLAKVTLNLLENSESDSMHLQYNVASPPSAVEIMLRGEQAVSITTDAYGGRDSAYRGPCVRTTAEPLNPVIGEITVLNTSLIREARYPDGRLVELRDGDLIFEEGTAGVAALLMSITGASATLVTRLNVGGE